MNEDQGKVAGETHVRFAALMPHAPVLVPGIGRERAREVAATIGAMRAVAARMAASGSDSLVVISPHSPRRGGAFGVWGGPSLSGSLGQFGGKAEPFELPNDEALARCLEATAAAAGGRTWTISRRPLDHGAVVPLWFLFEAQWRKPIVVLSLDAEGEAGLAALGEAIRRAAERAGRRVAILASGDMSHALLPDAPAGFDPRAREFDQEVVKQLQTGQYRELASVDPLLRDLAAEDVIGSTLVALAAIRWANDGHEVLSYEGPFGVGYGVAVLYDPQGRGGPERESETVSTQGHPARDGGPGEGAGIAPEAGEEAQTGAVSLERLLPRIARDSVTAALSGDKQQPPEPAQPYLRDARGVFVTLRDLEGDLRGCVGSLVPQSPDLAREIWRIAREAAFSDSRFSPVVLEELPGLRFEISVLHPLEHIDSAEQLDPHRYGVVIGAADGRRGVLLPAIPGIDSVEEQLRCVHKKAGIGGWEKVQMSRFEVDKFMEAD